MRQLTSVLGLFVVLVVAGAGAPAAQSKAAADKPATKAAAKATASAPVNLNTATSAQLETLPGVGSAAAKRIIEYRQKNGSFKKIEELMNVKGFGEKTFLKLKPLIAVADKADRPGGEK
jgi:competence protein ComEA